MSDVIPSFYDTRSAGTTSGDGGAFSNDLLRPGEVHRIVYPEDANSRSHRFIEYDVVVQHRENGTAVTKMYHNCFLANELAGHADYSFRTLRPAATDKGQATDDLSPSQPTLGSKVTLLCLNGEHSEAIIIGGVRDERSSDVGRKTKGHHLEWVFNGVAIAVNDDGSFSVTYRGPTTPDGQLDTSKVPEAKTGTSISVAKDGTFTVATRENKQLITIDHSSGAIHVHADNDLVLHGKQIHVTEGADQHMVLGDALVDLFGQMLDLMAIEQHPTPIGVPTGFPVQAPAYKALKAQLRTILSTHSFVKRAP